MNKRIIQQPGRKDRVTYVRIPDDEASIIEARANEEGFTYYAYVASILHKYVTGKLISADNKNYQHKTGEQHRRAAHG